LRIVVFVDGCFWHGCPLHGNRPRYNGDWWRQKIERNQRRDRDTDQRLGAAGWTVVRAWEHDDPVTVAATVAAQARRASRAVQVSAPSCR
jgi:DNA mismatch endonuclease (patch repair protein)